MKETNDNSGVKENRSSIELRAIVAMGRRGEIGFRGDMPWHLPEDLRHFKEMTMGHPVIMGRRTWESLPKRPLPGRVNVVLTRSEGYDAPGALVASGIEEGLAMVEDAMSKGDKVSVSSCDSESEGRSEIDVVAYVIGGGNVYEQSLPLVSRVFVTRIDAEYPEADTFFPSLDGFRLVSVSEPMTSKIGLRYWFEDFSC